MILADKIMQLRMPGDPGRVEKIGAKFDNPKVVAYNREYKTITGMADFRAAAHCA